MTDPPPSADADMPHEPSASVPSHSRWRRWRRMLLEILVVLTVVGAIAFWRGQAIATAHGDWSEVTVVDLQGAPHPLTELLADRSMVHVWATWCGVCKANHGLVDLSHALLNAPPARSVVTLVTDDASESELRAHLTEYGVDAPVYVISSDDAHALGVRAFPTTLFMDETAQVHRAIVGFVTPFGGAIGMAMVN